MRHWFAAACLWTASTCVAVVSGHAGTPDYLDASPARDRAVFFFAGALTKGDMLKSANPIGVGYESHPVIGAGYQAFTHEWRNVSFGFEAGAAGRFGSRVTAEVWGGGVARYDSIPIGRTIRVSPAFTMGLSAISATHPGRESQLEERYDGGAKLLFYLGPEINVALGENSDTEFFWRLHHRSGAWRTLGDMKGAANANVFGVRRRF